MAPTAFTLREEYAGTVEHDDGSTGPVFLGGVIAIGDGDSLNIAEALEAGDGVIVVDDTTQADHVRALDEYPALKRTTVPEGAALTSGYDDATVSALREELKRRGITGAGNLNKADAVAALQRIDERTIAGDNVPADTSVTDLMADDADTEGAGS